MKNKQSKFQGSFMIANLLIAIFAFAVVLNSFGIVSGQNIEEILTRESIAPLSSTPTGSGSPSITDNDGWLRANKDRLTKSVTYAGVGLAAGQLIKELGGDEPWVVALGNGLQAGGAAAGASGLFSETHFIGGNAPLIGLGVVAIVFILTYKEVEYETVFFTCQPWEAPIGGNDCEKCNDGIHPCSEYRCKSLGQACGLVNKGTENELCVWQNRNDVSSPAIQPLEEVITQGYKYETIGARPPNWGTKIKPFGEDCIPAFTPIQFGIQTDKPSQCKIDFLIKGGGGQIEGQEPVRPIEPLGYDNMQFYFGSNNLYSYNHTQLLSLPSPDTVNRIGELNVAENGELEIRNDGNYNLYARCRSANGFYNADPYLINFCVESGPDLTPPIIEETSIRDGQPVNFGVDEVDMSIFTNEPSNCRWARDNDLSFKEMTNEMICANNLRDIRGNMLYECRTTLTGVQDRQENLFYFRCEDQPWEEVVNRNKMQSGKSFTLVGTEPLNIKDGSNIPKDGSIITGATTTVTVNLELETQNGYNKGEASCLYSADNETYIKFFETGTQLHKQTQDLTQGTYTYYYQCIDLGGNLAETSTSFEVFIDTMAPRVVRVLNDGNRLKIITDENSVCRYSNDINVQCNFDLNLGQGNPMIYPQSDIENEHLADWNLDEIYYIKCQDKNGKQPNPAECSIIVRPVELGDS